MRLVYYVRTRRAFYIKRLLLPVAHKTAYYLTPQSHAITIRIDSKNPILPFVDICTSGESIELIQFSKNVPHRP